MNAIGNNSNSELRQLFELFPILTTLLSNNLDLLGSVLDIVESYIFLDINALLQVRITPFELLDTYYMTGVRNRPIPCLCESDKPSNYAEHKEFGHYPAICVPTCTWISMGWANARFRFVPLFTPTSQRRESTLCDPLLRFLLTFMGSKGSTNIRTEVILAFARMAIADAQLFTQLMSATAAAREYSEESLWSELLDQWWRRVCAFRWLKRHD